MKVLLTGGSGQLGTELQRLGHYTAPSHGYMDITLPNQVRNVLEDERPDLIVHAAAYTDTQAAEQNGLSAWTCWRTNVLGTRHLVQAAKCPIVFISTETAIKPYGFYILTKVQAELELERSKYGFNILRTCFRKDPFEYPQAFTDMWTLGDTDRIIAKLIHESVHNDPIEDRVKYIGTGVKTVYDLAMRTRPTVRACRRADVSPHIPDLNELWTVSCES